MKCNYGLFDECYKTCGCIPCLVDEVKKYQELEKHREKMKKPEEPTCDIQELIKGFKEYVAALNVEKVGEDEPNPILYKCDRRACEVCIGTCHMTKDVRHAKNFELRGSSFRER